MKSGSKKTTTSRKSPTLKNLKPARAPRGGGNTIYIGSANGGVWKTTNFLTTD